MPENNEKSILDVIYDKLTETFTKYPVYYGMAKKHDLKSEWNYIVFSKSALRMGGTSNLDLTPEFSVHLIHENYIPEGEEAQLISAMQSIPGMRVVKGDGAYNYTARDDTKMVIEIFSVNFTKASKSCQ